MTSCKQCDGPLVRKGPGPMPAYCSNRCKSAHHAEVTKADGRAAQWRANAAARRPPQPDRELTCAQCGEGFTRPFTRGRIGKFCSPLCSGRYHGATRIADGRWALYNAARRGPGAECQDCGVELRTGAVRCLPCNGDRPHIPDAVRRAVYERDLWECQLCDLPVDPAAKLPNLYSPSLDHVVPFSLGGSDEESNLQMAHFICNARRQDRPLPR